MQPCKRNFRLDATGSGRHDAAMLGNALIINRIGPAVFAKLAGVFGGTSVRIPVRPATLQARVPALTDDEAEHVVGIAGDTVLYVRRNDRILARQSHVAALHAAGVSVSNIAAEVGLSDTRVRQILRERKNHAL